MYNVFKRPMFKRGGSTQGTGIMSHVERRPNYSIGGGVTPRVNARFGFGNFLKGGDKYFSSPTKINTTASAGGPGVESIISQSMLEELTGNQNRNRIVPPRGSPYMGGIYAAAPIAAQTGLAYLNRPRSTEALKYMKEMTEAGVMDETSALDYQNYAEELIKKDKQGKPISFTDAFFLDPETGTYPKFLGRTQDRQIKKAMEDELQAPGSPGYENRLKEMEAEKIAEATALEKEEEAKELAAIAKAEAAAEKDAKYTESDILSSVEDEKKILDKILPDNVSTSEKAFLIAKAMKGKTLSDKLDIAGTEGTKLAKGKSARDREKALLAYRGATQKDLAKIAAGKKGFSEKQLEEMTRLKAISENTKLSKEVREKAFKKLKSKSEVLQLFNSKEKGLSAVDAKLLQNLDTLATNLSRITDKTSTTYKKNLEKYQRARLVVLKNPDLADLVSLADLQIGLQFKKDGGRMGYALGTENPMTTRPAVGQVPTEETSKLSFEDLRNRLPQEITDGVVRLISSSDQALQDFSYIRTQGDVVKFNQKYGVNLVLPAEA
jgi:hypothetical protein